MSRLTLPSKMPRPDVYYDVRMYPVPNSNEKYVILYNGVDWSLARRGPGFYHRLGTYPTSDEANEARIKHLSDELLAKLQKLKEELDSL